MVKYEIIDTLQKFEVALEHLKGEKVIGVDTEFIRERSYYPHLSWIQISSSDNIFLIDCQLLPAEDLKKIKDVLNSDKILKIFHSALADQECFYLEWSWVAKPVFDTSVAASLLGYGDQVGLAKLISDTLRKNISKGFSRSHWDKRPLPKELQEYAAYDVAYLIPLYEKLEAELKKKNRYDWAMKESEIVESKFETNIDALTDRLCKGQSWASEAYSILNSLVSYREEQAQDLDIPRQWVLSNDVVVSLAKSRFENIEQIKHLRGLTPKQVSRFGEGILSAIARGQNQPQKNISRAEKVEADSNIKMFFDLFLNTVAKELEIVPRYLVPLDSIHKILIERGDTESWVEKGWLDAEAARLVGPKIEDFIKGNVAVRLDNQALQIYDCASVNSSTTSS